MLVKYTYLGFAVTNTYYTYLVGKVQKHIRALHIGPTRVKILEGATAHQIKILI